MLASTTISTISFWSYTYSNIILCIFKSIVLSSTNLLFKQLAYYLSNTGWNYVQSLNFTWYLICQLLFVDVNSQRIALEHWIPPSWTYTIVMILFQVITSHIFDLWWPPRWYCWKTTSSLCNSLIHGYNWICITTYNSEHCKQ